jgi:Cu/Ag efflux protein CusF
MSANHRTLYLLILLLTLVAGACNQNSSPSTAGSPTEAQSSVRRYHLTGKVISIDQPGKMVNIDGDAIPGFMEPMAMSYKVKPESELAKLHPGDRVSADLMVQPDGGWLENISLTGHAPPGPREVK